jgi:hypothetical protein
MTTFMPPPPAATFLAFHPQDNNIIAIGMEDSTIQIYNVRVDEVMARLGLPGTCQFCNICNLKSMVESTSFDFLVLLVSLDLIISYGRVTCRH